MSGSDSDFSAQNDSVYLELPAEILVHIFSSLDYCDLCRCACVNRIWLALSEANVLWVPLCHAKGHQPFWWPPDQRAVLTANADFQWKTTFSWHVRSQKAAPKGRVDGTAKWLEPHGQSYRGDKRHNQKCGFGIHTWPDGSSYEGNWAYNRRNGYGVYAWADGRRYEGEHRNDKRVRGTFHWPDGSFYVGEYANSKRHGRGKYVWPNGDWFEGSWVEGGRFGCGNFHQVATGRTFRQEWLESCFFDTENVGPLDEPIDQSDASSSDPTGRGGERKRKAHTDDMSYDVADADRPHAARRARSEPERVASCASAE
eukprot:TRINITY_DN215_c0_g2_i1.p2 TRINITY_DN215_c0_g2~~TRINITY_DN215_c0_g2_i1.p2  ORF type:complete len:313 (-),score=33.01 TRINITY_DN215_c0_g2_i1:237-1175(-)